jgi:hypothetical protein
MATDHVLQISELLNRMEARITELEQEVRNLSLENAELKAMANAGMRLHDALDGLAMDDRVLEDTDFSTAYDDIDALVKS